MVTDPRRNWRQTVMGWCGSICPHGALCLQDVDHHGDHRDKHCTWTDAEAIGEEHLAEMAASNPQLAMALELVDATEALAGYDGPWSERVAPSMRATSAAAHWLARWQAGPIPPRPGR